MTDSNKKIATQFRSDFDRFGGTTLSKEYRELREAAIDRFDKAGIPTTRDEEWKYTNVAPIFNNRLETSTGPFQLTKEKLAGYRIAGTDVFTIVFENGRLSAELSDLHGLPSGVSIGSLSEHLHHSSVRSYLGKTTPDDSGSFVDLNMAFLSDGAFVHVPEGVKLDKPLHILYVNNATTNPTIVSPRNLYVASSRAEIRIIESWHSIGSVHHGFTNSVTEVVAGSSAVLHLKKLQMENDQAYHIDYTSALQEANSEFNITTVTLGGAIVRNNLYIRLGGQNSTAHLYGLYILNGHQLVDNHSLVDHAVPNCYSNELYKGVLDEKGQGVFNGKIFVRTDAQKTNAYQSNKNILLSDDALMNTKPQLEIYADDVKCSHGATTGQLDEEALFYLRSRGIGEEHARAFLNIAFAADVINNISYEPLRHNLMPLIEQKLKKELSL